MEIDKSLQRDLEDLKEDGIHVDPGDPYSTIRALRKWLQRFKVFVRDAPRTWPVTLPHGILNTYILIETFFRLVEVKKRGGALIDEYIDCANLLLRQGRISVRERFRRVLNRRPLPIRHRLRLGSEDIDCVAMRMVDFQLFNEATIDAVLDTLYCWSHEGWVLLSYLHKQFPQSARLSAFLRKMVGIRRDDIGKIASAILERHVLKITNPPYSTGLAIAEN